MDEILSDHLSDIDILVKSVPAVFTIFPKIQNGCSAGARYSENKFIASTLQALTKNGVLDKRVAEKIPIIFDKATQHTIIHTQEEPEAFLAVHEFHAEAYSFLSLEQSASRDWLVSFSEFTL